MILATMPYIITPTQPLHVAMYATPRGFPIDGLTLFGLVAVSLMLITYAFEKRSRHAVLAFAAACVMGSIYGFLQGAWPFGVVEAIWSVVAFRRWWVAQRCYRVIQSSDRLRRRHLRLPNSEESSGQLN